MSRCPRDRCHQVTVSAHVPHLAPHLHHTTHQSLVTNIVTALSSSVAMMDPSRGFRKPLKIKYYFDTWMTQYCRYVVTTVSVSYCHDRSCCQTNICVDCPRLLMSGHTGGDKMQPQHFLFVCTLGTHYTTTLQLYNTTHTADWVWRFVGGEQRRRSVGRVFVFISML